MKYNERQAGSCTMIEWIGDVDLSVSPQAREQVLACLDGGTGLLVELSGVTHIDSSGVAVLIEAFQTAKKKKLRFGLLAPSRPVLDVLHLARVDDILPIHASAEEAVAPKKKRDKT